MKLLLVIALLALSNTPAWGQLPTTNDDQALVIQVGGATNDQETALYRLKYVHPLFERVKLATTADYAPNADRSDLLAGLQIYPLEPLLYFVLAGGAGQTPENEATLIIKTGVGYEYGLSELWFVDVSGGRDWESGVSGRWTAVIGLGKRF